MVYAVYRCLYGEDFIKESILSIIDNVDKVFVFWSDKVWGDVTEVNYKGEVIRFPKKFDNLIERVKEINSDKIELIYQGDFWSNNPRNNYTLLVNGLILPNYDKPDTIVFIEVDHVFADNDFEIALELFKTSENYCSKCRQIEMWRTPDYRVPERTGRLGPVFWDFTKFNEMPKTHSGGQPANNVSLMNSILRIQVYNLGFMVSKKTMYWKHLTAIAFSNIIKDSPPNIDWYEKTWLTWDFEKNNKNLEISKGYEHLLPYANTFNRYLLPKSVLYRYNQVCNEVY